VSEDFLDACERASKLVDTSGFDLAAPAPKTSTKVKKEKKEAKTASVPPKKAAAKKEAKTNVKKEAGKEEKKKSLGVPRVNENYRGGLTQVSLDDSNGGYFDCMLNQTDIKSNANKFYVIQLLQNSSGTSFATYTRWGRVGDAKCQDATFGPFSSKAPAISAFEKKFRDKTKNAWQDKGNFQAKAGKYTLIELDYTNDDDEDDVDMSASSGKESMPESELDNRLQRFMSLMFDIKMMEQALTDLNFDVKKMPLGKLSKEMVIKGNEILLELENEIKKKSPSTSKLQDLSSRFYTLIPHAFSRSQVPPTLRKIEDVRNKMRLLDTIHDIEAASKLMKTAEKERKENEKHIMDVRYEGMNCKIEPLEKKDKEFELCQKYLQSSWEGVASPQVESIFRVDREGEGDRFVKKAKKLGNRQLLWHGSPLANFGGILSQGLRIAPPEAPCSGYRFGKGIYLADMPSLSWRYCRSYGTPSCLILCDAALGKPAELPRDEFMTKPKPGSDSTLALGRIGPDPAGLVDTEYGFKVPAGKLKKIENSGHVSCHEAQYVVYDVAQVQIKYVLLLKPFKKY